MKTFIGLILLGIVGMANYHLLAKYPLPGDDGWDYLTVDSATRRLFVSHGTKVDVMDADQGKVLGEIPGTRGVHGIALAPEFNRGFISCGQANEVVIFDMRTFEILNRVAVGKKDGRNLWVARCPGHQTPDSGPGRDGQEGKLK